MIVDGVGAYISAGPSDSFRSFKTMNRMKPKPISHIFPSSW